MTYLVMWIPSQEKKPEISFFRLNAFIVYSLVLMDKKTVSEVKNILDSAKEIAIVGHRNPDGDAIGSSLGLYFYLKNLGHNVTVIMPNDFPDFLKWLPGVETIKIYEKDSTDCDAMLEKADVIFTLDFNTLERVGQTMQPSLEKSDAQFIMIDHHQQPADYAVVTYSDTSMSSTCEMVFHFIKSLDPEVKFSKDMATNLYTGIMTDTGSFRYASTSSTTHRVIAELMDCGVENSVIHQNIFDTNTPEQIKLLGTAFDNMTILMDYKTAFITLTQDELDAHNFKKGDTEGFVNYGLSIQGVVFAAIFIESKQDQTIKISFRSKGSFSVNDFARNHFNGGGHENAAGGRSSLTLDETIEKFISILPTYKDALDHAI